MREGPEDAEDAPVRVQPWWSSLAAELSRPLRPVATVGLVALASLQATLDPFHALIAALGAGLGVFVLRRAAAAPAEPTRLRVEPAHIVVGERRIPRTSLGTPSIDATDARCVVRVGRGGLPPLRFEVANVDAGRRLIERLNADLSSRPFVVSTISRFSGIRAFGLGLAAYVLAHVAPAYGVDDGLVRATALSALVVLVLLRMCSARVRVGQDAIEHRWLFWARRWSVGELLRVEHVPSETGVPHRLRLYFRDRDPEDIPIAAGAPDYELARSRVAAIVERVERAMHARGGTSPTDFPAWNDELAARGVDGWLDGLTQRGADGYRAAASRHGWRLLLEVVRDPRARTHDRVAAAIAVSGVTEARPQLVEAVRAVVAADVEAAAALGIANDRAALRRLLGRHLGPKVRVEPPAETDDAQNDDAETDSERPTPVAAVRDHMP